MLTTIKGVYDHGKITLAEEPPVQDKVDVIVTFMETVPAEKPLKKNEIRFGSLSGKLSLPENFNEPLDELKDYM